MPFVVTWIFLGQRDAAIAAPSPGNSENEVEPCRVTVYRLTHFQHF